jgi:hypothetical protein
MSSEQGWPVYKRLGFIQRDLFVWQKADGTRLDMPSEPVAILEPPSTSEKGSGDVGIAESQRCAIPGLAAVRG